VISKGEKEMSKLQTKMILLAGLAAATLLPAARADEWSQRTVITFSDSVEIPGQVLPAGTYVFKLANSQSNRHIVQIFNKNENHLFGTFLAIPSYRQRPSEKTIIRFEERAAGSPQAVKAWFYPSRNYGHEFVYPKTEALALAQANNTPVPAMPALPPDTTKPVLTMRAPQIVALYAVPLKAEEPSGEEVELAQVSAPPSELPATLPETASPMPLIGLVGMLSLGAAATLRIAAVRVK
jgi:hypothetical protein